MNLSSTLKTSTRKSVEEKKTTSKPTFLSLNNYFDYLDTNNDILNEINDEPLKTVYTVNSQIEAPQTTEDRKDLFPPTLYTKWDDLDTTYYISQELDDKPFIEYEDGTLFDIEKDYYAEPDTLKWSFNEERPNHIRNVKYDKQFEKSKIKWPIPTRKKYQSFSKPGKYRKPYYNKYENPRRYFKKKPNYSRYKDKYKTRTPQLSLKKLSQSRYPLTTLLCNGYYTYCRTLDIRTLLDH